MENHKSSSEITREYGMSSSTLHKWIKKYTEIKKLQKKLALLEEENIILKKAMAILDTT